MIFLLLALMLPIQNDAELDRSLRLYWEALQARNKASVIDFVHPEDLNKFINRREALFDGWELVEWTLLSEVKTEVTVKIARVFASGATFPVKVKETWQKVDGEWKVRIQSLEDYHRNVMAAGTTTRPFPPRLDVFPKILKFYSFSGQPGVITIRNGLASSVQPVGLEIDFERFQITSVMDEVRARSVGRIALSYIGDEKQENLKSQAKLKLKQDGEIHEFLIPILYNTSDPTLSWIERQRPQATDQPEKVPALHR